MKRSMLDYLLALVLLVPTACADITGEGVEIDEEGDQASSAPIVGGTASASGTRLYQVSLQTSYGSHFCGGALISSQWVLTAAHCVDSGETIKVKVGSTSLSSATSISVSSIIVHPSYNAYTNENDIALLKLSSAASSSLTPLALPTSDVMADAAAPGDLATVSGWGTTSEGGYTTSQLREVNVPVVSNSTCNAYNSYNGSIVSSMLCAGYSAGGKDSCQGDSGGPLAVSYQGKYYSVGVVSFGDGCARPNKYGVYTRTQSFNDWITSKTGIQVGGGASSSCGNGRVDSGESCDGSSVSCSSLNASYTSGTASCNSSCSGWDVTKCQGSSGQQKTISESGEIGTDEYVIVSKDYIQAGAGTFTAATSGSGDVDLYVWKDVASPNWGNFTCRPYADGSKESCSLSGPGKFLVAVRGYASYSSFTATVSYTP